MTDLIVVTGATGVIGSELIAQLVAAEQRVRALVRNPAKTAFDASVEVVQGDLQRPETLDIVFAGAAKAFVAVNGEDIANLEINAYDAARRAGIGHIVKVSALEAFQDHMAGETHAAMHRRGEEYLRSVGVAWTMLRPGFFASNLQTMFLRATPTGAAVYVPAGGGREAPIDPTDIAATGVAVLTSGGHEGKVYDLTGPHLLTYAEMTDGLSAATGVDVEYVDVTEAEARAKFLADGYPPEYGEFVLRHYAGVRAGEMIVTGAVADVLGRPAQTFEGYIRRNTGALKAFLTRLAS
ncbi:SDR family oxidoreductase [Mycolicibacterium moriokaense]|uniref:Uncharacterized protein YbjT (DUF2867 family) n=1 Tax=Mycolicibacterium moriokaense TaxID=39691 RepID=A0A318HD02_9MYCO|nr:SDR family oxidoreductase [Mycolicibacterium moriokaense]PXW98855.1 uncharacterized protein YbjT (DUF2867 family) [Mycolicibacterium moriokaense]